MRSGEKNGLRTTKKPPDDRRVHRSSDGSSLLAVSRNFGAGYNQRGSVAKQRGGRLKITLGDVILLKTSSFSVELQRQYAAITAKR